MKLIVVNGISGSGKTTLARKLSKDLKLKLISKDDIKEFLFDYIGTDDVAWSQMLGAKCSDLMMDLTLEILKKNESLIIENAFSGQFAKPQLENFMHKIPDLKIIEVYCEVPFETSKQRYINRIKSGERHLGHRDELRIKDYNESFKHIPIGLGDLIRVDTSSNETINYEELLDQLAK